MHLTPILTQKMILLMILECMSGTISERRYGTFFLADNCVHYLQSISIFNLIMLQVSAAQSVALSWFHARCTHHCKQLRLSIQKDTIALVGKLFGSPDVCMSALPPEPIPSTGKGTYYMHVCYSVFTFLCFNIDVHSS